jgi:ABC-type Mn2+/Zn2+ transport system ATPase subunit
MASMDHIYDILSKLEKENIDYLFITLQHGKVNSKADVFYSLNNEEKSFSALREGLKEFQANIDKSINKFKSTKKRKKKTDDEDA